jgi:hypothetical protein
MSVRKIKTFRQWPTLLGEAVHERLKFLLKILGMSLLFLFIGPPSLNRRHFVPPMRSSGDSAGAVL